MKARFAFGEHVDTRSPLGCAGNQTSAFDRIAIVFLNIPAIWMGEDILDGIVDRFPEKSRVMFYDVRNSVLEKVLYEICQNIDDRFPGWKWGYIIVLDVGVR